MSISTIKPATVTAIILDSEGRVVHLGIPRNSDKLLANQGLVAPAADTHAFIVHDCKFNGEQCQIILAHPMINNESNHGGLTQMLRHVVVPGLEINPRCVFSGECRSSLTADKLTAMAESENRQTLSGMNFALRGTTTTHVYRTSQNLSHDNVTKDILSPGDVSLSESKPELRTFIPIALLTLDRKQFDAGMRIVAPGLDESRLPSVKERISHFEESKTDFARSSEILARLVKAPESKLGHSNRESEKDPIPTYETPSVKDVKNMHSEPRRDTQKASPIKSDTQPEEIKADEPVRKPRL